MEKQEDGDNSTLTIWEGTGVTILCQCHRAGELVFGTILAFSDVFQQRRQYGSEGEKGDS